MDEELLRELGFDEASEAQEVQAIGNGMLFPTYQEIIERG